MENSNSNSHSNKLQRNRINRMIMLEGGVVGLSIVAAMNIANINNSTCSTHHADIIVSTAKAASNFRGTTNGLFFASTFNKIGGTHFVSPTSYFLNSCNLCNKHLHGVDIFIYRGESAFCSAECREAHIRNDDYQEKCRSGLMKPLHSMSMPPCSRPPLSLAGIAAA